MADRIITPQPNKVYGITNIKTYIPLILDFERFNYDAWRALFKTHCKAFDVFDHIDESTPKSTDADWEKIDNMIQLWLYGSISQNLLNMILKDGQSVRDIWVNLEKLFRSNKDSRAMQLENELRNITIGDQTASAYFTKIKTLSDQLENLGSKVGDRNLVMYAINGLSSKFPTVASIVRHRSPFPSFAETRDIVTLEEQTTHIISAPIASHQEHSSSPTVLHTSDNNNNGGQTRNQSRRFDGKQQNNWRRQPNQQQYGWVYHGPPPPDRHFQSHVRPFFPDANQSPWSGNRPTWCGNQQTWSGNNPPMNSQQPPGQTGPQWVTSGILGAPPPRQPPGFRPNLPHAHYADAPPNNNTASGPTQENYSDQATILPHMFNTFSLNDPGNSGWIMDTGATDHVHANEGLQEQTTPNPM